MTDGERLTAILAQYAIPCEKVSFRGKLDALAAGLGIQTQGRLLGDVLDDIAVKMGVERDNRLYGTFIRKLYEGVTSGEDATLSGNPLTLTECIGGKPFGALHVYGKSTQNGVPTPTAPVPIVSAGDGGTVTVTVSDGANESQTLTLQTPNALPGIPVRSGGNYTDENGQQWVCDEVDLEKGVKVQRVNAVDFSTCGIVGNFNLGVTKRITYALPLNACNADTNALCNKLQHRASFDKDTPHFYADAARLHAFIPIGAKNPEEGEYILFYALATPIETPLTPAEIAAYKALTTYAPTTIVTAGGGAWLAATYKRSRATKST